MKKKTKPREPLTRGKKILLAVLSPFMALALYWLVMGALAIGPYLWQSTFGNPGDILNGNPWRGNMFEQDGWRQIVQNSRFPLGEPVLTQAEVRTYLEEQTYNMEYTYVEKTTYIEPKLSLPDATFPNIDGGTVMVPMMVEFVRQHLGMTAEQARGFFSFKTTQPAFEAFCSRSHHDYHFYTDFFDGFSEYTFWDTQRPIDLLLGSPPGEEALRVAAETGVEFAQKPICCDAFVFITGKNNPVESLTIEQLRGIFSGEITNWKQVGGQNKEIGAYQREPGSGSQVGMEQLVMRGLPMADAKTVRIVTAMGDLIDAVAEYENSAASIGYSYRYYIDNQYSSKNIKQLKIEGVAPTDENIASRAYPLSVNYYGVIRKGEEQGPGGLFLDWILSEEGQACVEQAGYIPLG